MRISLVGEGGSARRARFEPPHSSGGRRSRPTSSTAFPRRVAKTKGLEVLLPPVPEPPGQARIVTPHFTRATLLPGKKPRRWKRSRSRGSSQRSKLVVEPSPKRMTTRFIRGPFRGASPSVSPRRETQMTGHFLLQGSPIPRRPNQPCPVPRGLVFQHPPEGAPRRAPQRPGQPDPLEHLHIQVLHHENRLGLRQLRGEPVQKVLAEVVHPAVQPSQAQGRFGIVPRPLPLARKLPGAGAQKPQGPRQRPGPPWPRGRRSPKPPGPGGPGEGSRAGPCRSFPLAEGVEFLVGQGQGLLFFQGTPTEEPFQEVQAQVGP